MSCERLLDLQHALAARAECFMRRRLFARAAEDWTAVLQLAPNDVAALFARGSALDKLGHVSEAVVRGSEAPTPP